MFGFFRVKSKISLQIEEYIKFKAKHSPYIARDQEEFLNAFITHIKSITINDITPEKIETYHQFLKTTIASQFVPTQHMRAIRAFIRFHKHDTEIIPDKITNTGIEDLKDVGRILPEVPTTRPRVGRPMNVELVKKVKRLRDKENLSFRAISKALGKDVKNVYLMYKYKISSSNVGKIVIHRTKDM